MATVIHAAQKCPPALDRNRVDLTWERMQEQAMQAFKAGKATVAGAGWAKALEIAERHFERGDPRLAASLSNHAYALLRRNQAHQASIYFRRALVAWDESWCWVPWMAPSSSPGESEPAPYDQQTQDAFYALIRQGRTITKTLQQERHLPEAAGDDWSTVKPKGMNDIRRLFSAVFLMPTAQERKTSPGRGSSTR